MGLPSNNAQHEGEKKGGGELIIESLTNTDIVCWKESEYRTSTITKFKIKT